ncbi:hypothetical protein GOBAR_DD22095 [Gossypium barbadense]|nr:hypothetical protein GOBAR_DD22095 [Gossypium barbadense]
MEGLENNTEEMVEVKITDDGPKDLRSQRVIDIGRFNSTHVRHLREDRKRSLSTLQQPTFQGQSSRAKSRSKETLMEADVGQALVLQSTTLGVSTEIVIEHIDDPPDLTMTELSRQKYKMMKDSLGSGSGLVRKLGFDGLFEVIRYEVKEGNKVWFASFSYVQPSFEVISTILLPHMNVVEGQVIVLSICCSLGIGGMNGLINIVAAQYFPKLNVFSLPRLFSDHHPIVFNTDARGIPPKDNSMMEAIEGATRMIKE